jgi:hypothetical protein
MLGKVVGPWARRWVLDLGIFGTFEKKKDLPKSLPVLFFK